VAPRGEPGLRPWAVPAVAVDPAELDDPADELRYGASVAHLRAVAAFADDLARRGHVLPTLDPSGTVTTPGRATCPTTSMTTSRPGEPRADAPEVCDGSPAVAPASNAAALPLRMRMGSWARRPPPRYVPLPAESPQPTSAAMASIAASVGTSASANRGACVMKVRSKRAPSAQPISTCAEFVSHDGIVYEKDFGDDTEKAFKALIRTAVAFNRAIASR